MLWECLRGRCRATSSQLATIRSPVSCILDPTMVLHEPISLADIKNHSPGGQEGWSKPLPELVVRWLGVLRIVTADTSHSDRLVPIWGGVRSRKNRGRPCCTNARSVAIETDQHQYTQAADRPQSYAHEHLISTAKREQLPTDLQIAGYLASARRWSSTSVFTVQDLLSTARLGMHLCRSLLEHTGKNDPGENDAWGWEELIKRLSQYRWWNSLHFWEQDVSSHLNHDWKDGQISASPVSQSQSSGLKRAAQSMGPPKRRKGVKQSDGGNVLGWIVKPHVVSV